MIFEGSVLGAVSGYRRYFWSLYTRSLKDDTTVRGLRSAGIGHYVIGLARNKISRNCF